MILLNLNQLLQLSMLLLLVAEPQQHRTLPDQVHVQLGQALQYINAKLTAPLGHNEIPRVVLIDASKRDEQIDERMNTRDRVQERRACR